MPQGTIHPISDAGRRMSESIDRARQTGGEGRWVAILMETGSWDGNVYDTKADAIRHASEDRHCYLPVPPMAMPPAEATHWIDLHRRLLASGWKMTDPDRPVPIPSLSPLNTQPRPGPRPSGLVIPQQTRRRTR